MKLPPIPYAANMNLKEALMDERTGKGQDNADGENDQKRA